MTHGHELKWGNACGREGAGWRGIMGRKKWDNCNSIINNIYLKMENKNKIMPPNKKIQGQEEGRLC